MTQPTIGDKTQKKSLRPATLVADKLTSSLLESSAPTTLTPVWGGPLTADDYKLLESSWITPQLATKAMLRRVDDFTGRQVIGQKGKRDCAGILFPYYWPSDSTPCNYRLRRDNPDWISKDEGKPKQSGKYLGPPRSGNRLYVPPGVPQAQLDDISFPIAIVEGEKKAIALWRLALHESEVPRFIPIGIAGVWNWRGKTGTTGGPNGERLDVRGPIADLSRIEWTNRKVFIVFDANVHTNDSVEWARKGIARELTSRGAMVEFVNLPEGCGVNGIDDLLAIWGPDKVVELFKHAIPAGRNSIVLPPEFQSAHDGMFRVINAGGKTSRVQLTNFQAAVVANIRFDDGMGTRRAVEIEAQLLNRTWRFTISASEFARMDWPIEHLGSSAITYPNKKDYARTAIQSFSMTAEERCIFTHTGWRQIDGRRIFLHAGGAVGVAGPLSDYCVQLSGPLGRYQLTFASDENELQRSIQASLRLLTLAEPVVSFPLLAAVVRAVLGEADFALHLVGETGAFKSEIAALHQQHFGAEMNRQNLPGAWSSTANALEVSAFHAKDTLFVVDDFAPHGSNADIARYC